MRYINRYHLLTIPHKLKLEFRIITDNQRSAEYFFTGNDNEQSSLTLHPMITISIVRPKEKNDNGGWSSPWNINDSLAVTKFQLPILIRELKTINESIYKVKNLYMYKNKQLCLDETAANKLTRAFKIAMTTIELSVVVIIMTTDAGEERMEGIMMKFNNDESSVLLTLNEIESLIYNLDNTDMDSLAFNLFQTYRKQ